MFPLLEIAYRMGSDNDEQRRGGWPPRPSRLSLALGALASAGIMVWSFLNALRRSDEQGWIGFAIVACVWVAFEYAWWRTGRPAPTDVERLHPPTLADIHERMAPDTGGEELTFGHADAGECRSTDVRSP